MEVATPDSSIAKKRLYQACVLCMLMIQKCKVRRTVNNTNRKHGSEEKIDLQETTLEKDLGVHMDPELKFSQHLERQVNKAKRLLGLIRRSLDYLDCDTMKLLFAALVWPHLEFRNCVWAPYLGKDKKLTESVLRLAAKVVGGLKDLSYEQCLKRVGLPSMGYLCLRGDIIETYKFTHCLYTTQDELITVDTKSVTRGHSYKPPWKPPFDRLFLHKELLNIGTHCKQMWSRLSRIV